MRFPLNIHHIQDHLFRRHRWLVLLVSSALYAGGILLFGPQLRVSSNYLVALPVIAAAMGFGFWGGFSAGMLGLPVNLILFSLIGYPQFAPESLIIAEVFGILVGGSMGALGDYFRILNEEIRHNQRIANELQQQISDREVLIQEVHHRVKNNLTLILSLLQLQRNQFDSPEYRNALEIVSARIRAIASVHDYIYTHETSTSVNLQRHLPALCEAIIESHQIPEISFHHDVQFKTGISLQKATPLSLIILEILTNSCKHAFSSEHGDPRIFLYGRETANEYILIISDNGAVAHGVSPLSDNAAAVARTERTAAAGAKGGLGSTIIKALTRQIRADLIVNTDKGYEYVLKIRKSGQPFMAAPEAPSRAGRLDPEPEEEGRNRRPPISR